LYLAFEPDFLGLQECDPRMTAVISDLIKDKYEIVRYTRSKEGINRHNYTPIFYYKSRWEQVDGGWFLFERACWTMTWVVLQSKEDPAVRCLHANLHQTPWGGEELMNCSIAINGELKRLREKKLCKQDATHIPTDPTPLSDEEFFATEEASEDKIDGDVDSPKASKSRIKINQKLSKAPKKKKSKKSSKR
jgi:hypothetical protein